MKEIKKIKASISISPEIYEKVREIAEADHRSVSSMIEKILADHFDEGS